MRSFLKLTILTLLFALSTLPSTVRTQQATSALSPIPKQVTLTIELQDLPGRDLPGNIWEVSYEWRIADERAFDQWSAGGENPSGRTKPGILLSKESFARRNLFRPENRRFSASIPVVGEILERISKAGQQRQIVWLEATVRLRDANLGVDVIKRVNPAWGPDFYHDGVASVRMELTSDGKLRWFTTTAPPWAGGQSGGMRRHRQPNQ